ncbi:3-beta hydroxysteroid dehydrogenase, partial [Streptomyces albidoflavus]
MRPLVTVSGTPVARGRPSAEDDPLSTAGQAGGAQRPGHPRPRTGPAWRRAVPRSACRVRSTVHHEGQGGFTGLLTESARRAGVAGFPGDGAQRWPAVHALDAAVLFRLALEGAPGGSSRHAVA